jgi:hypothetical protein
MEFKFYLKKLTFNELGYRNGQLMNGQMFYISKQAACFFPHLSSQINNDSVLLEFKVDYKETPIHLNLVYHNDKYNREFGTRDEYRIYLNREIAPDDFFFRPGDIIVIEKKVGNKYILKKYREGNNQYENLNEVIQKSYIRGQHALLNNLPYYED